MIEKSVRLKAVLKQDEYFRWFLELESSRKSNKFFREFLNNMQGREDEVLVLEAHDSMETFRKTRVNFRVKIGPNFDKIEAGMKALINWVTKK